MQVQDTAKNCVVGKPFTKGSDPRRNTRGRPKNFDELRRLSQLIGAEETTDSKGNVMTRIEHVLRKLAASSDPQALRIFLEYGFGRPVDRLEVDEVQPKPTLILHYAHERPDLVQPAGQIKAVNGAVTRRPLLPGAAD